MSDSNQPDFEPERFEEFLRELLEGKGAINAEELAKMAGLPNDPKVIEALIQQLRQAVMQGDDKNVGGVNWEVATQQAIAAARDGGFAVGEGARIAVTEAARIADLWLDQATNLSALASEPKLLTREVWVQDSLPLFQELASPIATRVASALAENLEQNLPESQPELFKGAAGIMRSAGGAMFAMQLGQTLGRLSREVLSGGDIGLPFYSDSRAAFVTQNLSAFIAEQDIAVDQGYIYFTVRELAHARLFKHSRWLRDAVIGQITNYATDIHIDNDRLQELASELTSSSSEELRNALQSGDLLANRTDDQNEALRSIEALLALIEGWVELVTEQSTKLLPNAVALGEILRRRRATNSPAKRAFATLLGLELSPKLSRTAVDFWKVITEELGVEGRDAIWDHPDLLPTADELSNPHDYLKRTQNQDDDLDQALKDLLGE